MTAQSQAVVSIGLSAAIVSVADERPSVLVVRHADHEDALPFGPFDPLNHRTLDSGLRKWVGEQTLLDLGYAEQLYTFGEPAGGMCRRRTKRARRIGRLSRADRQASAQKALDTQWSDWYRYFPWEDWRDAKPALIDQIIAPALRQFAKTAPDAQSAELRRERTRLCFGFDGLAWDEEKVLERYELLYEAGLVQEAVRDGRKPGAAKLPPALGAVMTFDHRRILATAIARLRGKMKYRPVVFELMPPSFTLLELQRSVEAISGIRLHKQNFRRLMEDQGLVERTGKFSTQGRGRPAELFRFRREVLRERPAPGVRLGARARGTG